MIQNIDELDKNHHEGCTGMTNGEKMYVNPGKFSLIQVLKKLRQTNISQLNVSSIQSNQYTYYFIVPKNSKYFSFIFSDAAQCPVDMYEQYRGKLDPSCNHLWQRPKTTIKLQ